MGEMAFKVKYFECKEGIIIGLICVAGEEGMKGGWHCEVGERCESKKWTIITCKCWQGWRDWPMDTKKYEMVDLLYVIGNDLEVARLEANSMNKGKNIYAL